MDGDLILTDSWRRPKDGSAPARLWKCYEDVRTWIAAQNVDIVCVEFLSVERNAQTTRIVSHYQCACTLAAKSLGLVVVEAQVRTARRVVFGVGNGGRAKKEIFEMARKRFPDHSFGRFELDGGDKVDAAVLALAAPTLAERS